MSKRDAEDRMEILKRHAKIIARAEARDASLQRMSVGVAALGVAAMTSRGIRDIVENLNAGGGHA